MPDVDKPKKDKGKPILPIVRKDSTKTKGQEPRTPLPIVRKGDKPEPYRGKLTTRSISSDGTARKFVSSGVTPDLASEYVDSLDGNVQKAWHSWGPGAIKDYMDQGMTFAEARAEAMGDFGYDIDPLGTGPKLWSGYTWEPTKKATPRVPVPRDYGYDNGGGGGGGGGYAPPPVPEMKIRTSTGLRRSPYWESEDPFAMGFQPRFVVLGDQSQW